MRIPLRPLLLATLALSACRTAREAPATATARPDCGPAIPGMEAVLKPGAFIVLGELHGTQEAPEFATRLACHAASRGQPVRLALELPLEDQGRIDTFLAAEGADTRALTDSAHWRREVQDGRSSEAMRQVLERVRSLKRAGLPLQVVTFDPGGKDRDQTMAEQLKGARSRARADTFIVLVGNLHARRDVGAPWDPTLQFMTHRLLETEPGLVALDAVYSGGSAWVCRGMTADTCGQQPVRARAPERVGLVLEKLADDPDGYDGTWSAGELHASPPALGAAAPAAQPSP